MVTWVSGAIAPAASPVKKLAAGRGIRVFQPATLKDIRVQEVMEMKFVSPSQAKTTYGDGHECGAIFVVRRKP